MITRPARSHSWWKDAVFYQVYPRSFADGNADGVGDLAGLTQRLEHIADMGVEAVWVSPIFPSPMKDGGYDVSDYYNIDPMYGDLATFDRFLERAHALGLRVLLDLVPSHCSSEHPWFQDARSSRDSAFRDWFIWRDQPANNWTTFTGDPAWTLDERTGQYYLHTFLPEQPDLNWANPDVVSAIGDVLRFWFDRGVDGFRLDVIHCIGKCVDVDDPPEAANWGHCPFNDVAETHDLIRGLRNIADSYPGGKTFVGEVFLFDLQRVATYHGTPDAPELDLVFNFPMIYSPWSATELRARIDATLSALEPRQAWPAWVLGNHDNPRQRTRYGSLDAARCAAVLLLTLPGTPFIYGGEEIGMVDAEVPPSHRIDPIGRDGCRAPIPWDGSPDHGWPGGTWLPMPADAEVVNVAEALATPTSILHLYRTLIRLRRRPALSEGSFEWVDCPANVLAYRRQTEDEADECMVVINIGPEVSFPPGAGWRVCASTSSAVGDPFTGHLDAQSAVVLERPR